MHTTLQTDHCALPVFDVAATYHFYGKVIGLPLINAFEGDDWGGKPWLMMIFALPDQRQLALCALRGARRPRPDDLPEDVRHFAFSVASAAEYGRWKRHLRAHGVGFAEEDHGSQQSIYFKDPNGVVLEITTPSSAQQATADPHAHDVVKRWMEAERG